MPKASAEKRRRAPDHGAETALPTARWRSACRGEWVFGAARPWNGACLAAGMVLQARVRSRRALPSHERLRLVIVECGAARLPRADGFDETIVVAQMQGEPSLAFAQRVIDRLATIERAGRQLESAMLLAGDDYHRQTNAARRLLVLALSAHARARGGMSELTLASLRDASPESCAELLGLAEELMVLPNGDSVPVRVRFGSNAARAPRQSGMFSAFRGEG